MRKNILVAVGSLLIGLVVGHAIPRTERLGGSAYNRTIEFSEGISVDDTTAIDGTRNATFVDITASDDLAVTDDFTFSGTTGSNIGSGTASSVALFKAGNSITSTIVFGSVNAPVCFAAAACTTISGAGDCTGAATVYWYVFSVTGVQGFARKPATCP